MPTRLPLHEARKNTERHPLHEPASISRSSWGAAAWALPGLFPMLSGCGEPAECDRLARHRAWAQTAIVRKISTVSIAGVPAAGQR
jgi:hypothetical protein